MTQTYDHHHENDCAKLPCPRCGDDPSTGQPITENYKTAYSCSVCQNCWTSIEADMLPEERETYEIPEYP